MLNYTIYKITNNINGKIYIGRTTQPMLTRWVTHKGARNAKKNKHLKLYRAFNKYGIENFSIESVYVTQSFADLKAKEENYIMEFQSYLDDIGYNMSVETNIGLELISEESKLKRSRSLHKTQAAKRKGKYGLGVTKLRNSYYAGITHQTLVYRVPASTQTEAQERYDMLAIKIHGDDAVLNRPDIKDSYTQEKINETYEHAKLIQSHSKNCKYFGVYQKDNWFMSQITKDKVLYHLGYYRVPEEAALAVDRARLFLYGGKPSNKVNFPDQIEKFNDNELSKWFFAITDNRTRGLNYDKRIDRYGVSVIDKDKNYVGFGYYDNPEEAAKIRDMAVIHLGLDEILNYPEEIEAYRLNTAQIIIPILEKKKKFKGVTYNKKRERYMAIVCAAGRSVYAGLYDSKEEAARGYDKKALELLGDKAKLNFP